MVEHTQRSKKADVAVLKIACKQPGHHDHPSVNVGSDPYPGQELFAVGTPDDVPWTYNRMVSTNGDTEYNVHIEGMTIPEYRLEGDGFFGDSGAGVFDTGGNLVGIFNAIGDHNNDLMVPMKYVQALLAPCK